MTKACVLALLIMVGSTGCAGFRQFPQVPQDHDRALRSVDADYAATVDLIYGKEGLPNATIDPTQARLLRNRMLERRMAVIDAYFKEFQADLVKENVRADFGLAVLGIGAGAAGSLAAETASQILSAVSGGLAGTQAAYGKSVLYEKAMAALLAQMQAGRKTIAAQIYQRWDDSIEQYPMWMARTDLEAYYFAGSLPGAILATAADARTKEREAELQLRPITSEAASVAMIERRKSLTQLIDALEPAKARSLIQQIEALAASNRSFADAKKFLDDQFPAGVRTKDTDGKETKVWLRRAVVHSVRNARDADTWQSLIGGL